MRGVIRPEEGIRGVSGRGKLNGNGVAGVRFLRDPLGRKKFCNCKTREPQQVSSGARAIVVANDFDSHSVGDRDL